MRNYSLPRSYKSLSSVIFKKKYYNKNLLQDNLLNTTTCQHDVDGRDTEVRNDNI